MKIVEQYSHLNGYEFLKVHNENLIKDVLDTVAAVDAEACKTKVSKEKTMRGKKLYNPDDLNKVFARELNTRGWEERRHHYCAVTDRVLLNDIVGMEYAKQKEYLEKHGHVVNKSYKQVDFVKQKAAIEVQFGKYAFVAYDLFVKHLLFYTDSVIDVGIEILPMKSMARDPDGGRSLSTGIAYFEGEVYNVLRHGRGSPPVPLWIVGIAP